MKMLVALCCLSLAAAAPLAFGQVKGDGQKKQQERMKSCNEKAGDKKGEERKKFMSACLKGDAGETGGKKTTAQQDKMKACNKQASAKKLKGDERKKFMSGCLKG
jgi:psiF repeat